MSSFVILAAILFGFLFLTLAIVAPKALVLFIWPFLFCYPHRLTLGLLPLNIGMDDIYIILVFLVVIFRFGFGRLKWPVKAVLAFSFVFFMSNMTGLLTIPSDEMSQDVLKRSLKNIILILFTWNMSNTMETERDLQLHMVVFLLSVAAASLIAIADFLGVEAATWFHAMTEARYHYRARGPFLAPDGVGANILLPVFVSISLASLRGRSLLRSLAICLCVIYLGAVLLASSRSGWLGLIIGTMAMSLTVRRKHTVILAVGLVLGGFVLFFGGYWAETVVVSITGTFTEVGFSSHYRFEIWTKLLRNPYPAMLFFGRGMKVTGIILNVTPHSLYFDIIHLLGLGGTILFACLFFRYLRICGWLRKHDPDPLFQMYAQGFWLGFIAVLGFGISADPFWEMLSRYGLFFWLSWLWARQEMLAYEGYLVPYLPKELICSSDYGYYDQPYETYAE